MSFDSAYLRALSAVLFAAVCAYVGAALFSGGALYGSVQARRVELCDTLPLEGIAIRSERVVRGTALASGVESGKRLCAGTALAHQGDELVLLPRPALFLSDEDGYEHLGPEILEGLDERGLDKLLAAPPQPQSQSLGRLVHCHDWYYAAFAPLGDKPLSPGRCLLDFGGGEPCPARLIRCREYEGRQLVVFRIIEFDEGLLSLRKCSASLVLSDHEGIAVPAAALGRDEEGMEFVCVVSAAGERRVAVESIYRSGQLCLVRPLEEGALPEGSRILGRAA